MRKTNTEAPLGLLFSTTTSLLSPAHEAVGSERFALRCHSTTDGALHRQLRIASPDFHG